MPPLARPCIALVLLAAACSDNGAATASNTDTIATTPPPATTGGTGGSSPDGTSGTGGSASGGAAQAGSSTGGSAGTTNTPPSLPADFDCATQLEGGPCDDSFLDPSQWLSLICDQTAEDIPMCRRQLICHAGAWAHREPALAPCPDLSACTELGSDWGYCRNDQGTLCFLPNTGPVRCGEDSPYLSYQTSFPLLGSRCEEEGSDRADCGYSWSMRCIGGVWIQYSLLCK